MQQGLGEEPTVVVVVAVWALLTWQQNLYPWDAREQRLGLVEATEQQVPEPERLAPELQRVVVETEP